MDVSVFATRTDFRNIANVKSTKEYIIGLDLGYSATKCITEDSAFCVPSFAREIRGEIIGGLSSDEIIYTNENGRSYSVGERALKGLKHGENVKETSIYGRNHYQAPEYLIQFRVGLGIALWNKKDTDERPFFIKTGLPPAYLAEDSAYMRKIMEGHHKFTLRRGNSVKEFDITVDSKQIDIIIQPMGTIISIGTEDYGKNQSKVGHFLRSRILIFDVGFGTLDTFYLRDSEVEARDTDERLGMKRVLEEARNAIFKDYPNAKTFLSIPKMQECLATGSFSYVDRVNLREDTIHIAPYIQAANEKVREEAFDSQKDNYADIDYLVMTGGLGGAWHQYFEERLKGLRVTVMKGNAQSDGLPFIYANARGYYMAHYGSTK